MHLNLLLQPHRDICRLSHEPRTSLGIKTQFAVACSSSTLLAALDERKPKPITRLQLQALT